VLSTYEHSNKEEDRSAESGGKAAGQGETLIRPHVPTQWRETRSQGGGVRRGSVPFRRMYPRQEP